MTEKKHLPEKGSLIPESLQNLDIIHKLILDKYFTDPTLHDWATPALFSLIYTDSDSAKPCYAPTAEALPYLLAIFKEQKTNINIGDLYITPVDGKNTRDIEIAAKSPDAANLALALDMANLFEFDVDHKLLRFGVRVGGDEFLSFSTKDVFDLESHTSEIVHTQYPATISVKECGLQTDATNQLKNIDLPPATHRPFDIVNLFYHHGKNKLPTAQNFDETTRVVEATSHLAISVEEFISEHDISEYPQQARETLILNPSNLSLRRLIDLATFNPMFDRQANVYTSTAFLDIVQEMLTANPDKEYLLVQFGPIGLKRINTLLTRLNGNIAIDKVDHLVTSNTCYGNIPRTQRAGSELALIENTTLNLVLLSQINHSVTDKSILHAEEDVDNPGIVITQIATLAKKINPISFWSEIVDPGKVEHYANEITVMIHNKCSTEAILAFISGRYNSRFDIVRRLILSDLDLRIRLSGRDLDILDTNLKDLSIPETMSFVTQLVGIFERLFPPQLNSSSKLTPDASPPPQGTLYSTTPNVSSSA